MIEKITTDRLIIRTHGPEISNELLKFYLDNQELFDKFDPVLTDNFYTEEFQRKSLIYEDNEIRNGVAMHLYVYLKEDPETIIGNIDFFRIRPNPFYSTILSYRFHKDYHNKGYATESIRAAINNMFENYNIHRIEARIAPDNTPSLKLVERLNFRYEGREFESVYIHNTFKDHLRYSFVRSQLDNK
ncbi:MAG: GNAT family N-acetyltransferase [Lachnospiraceae bacterium]|nr:GNAT family N-acetyltransferase [Lachnospiraceae bacterium]